MSRPQVLRLVIAVILVTLFLIGCESTAPPPVAEAPAATATPVPPADTPTSEPPTPTPMPELPTATLTLGLKDPTHLRSVGFLLEYRQRVVYCERCGTRSGEKLGRQS